MVTTKFAISRSHNFDVVVRYNPETENGANLAIAAVENGLEHPAVIDQGESMPGAYFAYDVADPDAFVTAEEVAAGGGKLVLADVVPLARMEVRVVLTYRLSRM